MTPTTTRLRILPTAIVLSWIHPPAIIGQDPAARAARLFDPGHLVEVAIELPPAEWDALRRQTRAFADALGKVPAKRPFRYCRGHVTIDGLRIEDVGIRKKGFLGSLDDVRPSLKIKFDRFVERAPVAGVDRLTLNNNKQDATQLSQYLGYRVFDRAGVAGPRCNLAVVTVNGTSLGIYSNVESIAPPLLRREFGDGGGQLFEGTVADLFTDGLLRFERKTRATTLEPLRRIAAVLARDELDPVALAEHLDLAAFLRFWATESLIGFWDGYTNNQNNYFIYRSPTDRKLYFMPWGLDSAFTTTMPLPPFWVRPRSVHRQSLLANRLFQLPALQERYRATLASLLRGVWNEAGLLAEVDAVEAMVKDKLHPNQRGFAAAVTKLRRFISTRRRELRRELKSWPPRIVEGPRRPVYFAPCAEATASFSTRWNEDLSGDQLERAGARFTLVLDGAPVEFKRVSARAEPSKWPTLDGSPPPPAIVLTGVRAADGLHFALGVSPAAEDFRPTGGKPVPVQGILIEGRLGWLNPKAYRFASGQVTFASAGMQKGAVVRGELSVRIVESRGGGTDRFKPK